MRERKRVAMILLLLAVLFALCWLPYNILQLLIDINAVSPDDIAASLPYTLLLGKIWLLRYALVFVINRNIFFYIV